MGKFLYVPAPKLCQGSDENLLIEMGETIFDGLVDRMPEGNGLRLRIPGDYMDSALLDEVANEFQILLGALRAWKPIAGERRDEVRPGVDFGSIRDENGNQVVHLGGIISHTVASDEIPKFSKQVCAALNHSQLLRNALWLNGRRDRNSADYFMIYEYSKTEFGSEANISRALVVPARDLVRLRNSANNLCPTQGGRHAGCRTDPEWGLSSQRQFTATLLKRWISHLANA